MKMIDLHSHILPGVDDGARSIKESLEMARVAFSDRIRTIVATPHLFRRNYPQTNFGIIHKKIDELREALAENNIEIEILRGAEVHVSHNIIDEIKVHREDLLLNKGSYLFVEFPSEHVFSGVKDVFFKIMNEGITPIIAHPERNSDFSRRPYLLYELIQMGALSQVNSGSFSGIYGREAELSVFRFLKLNLIHLIASDAHSVNRIPPRLSKARERVRLVSGEKIAWSLVKDNPQAILDNRDIPFFPDPVDPRENEKSLKIRLPHFFRRRV